MRKVHSAIFLSIVALLSVGLAGLCGYTRAANDAYSTKTMNLDVQSSLINDQVMIKAHKKKLEKAARLAELKAYQEKIAPDTAPAAKSATATLVRKIATTKPVVFLTIDDGLVKNPTAVQYIKDHKLNPTLFLTDQIIKDDYSYFKTYQDAGVKIENHTLTHPNLKKLSYAAQKAEICGQSDKLVAVYGTKPTIMRPPYGEFNDDTLRASHDCEIDFVVHWSAKVDGGAVQYQNGKHLVAGDVVLMHFRPMMMEDLKAFNDEVVAQGLTPAYLSDWLR